MDMVYACRIEHDFTKDGYSASFKDLFINEASPSMMLNYSITKPYAFILPSTQFFPVDEMKKT